MTKRLNFLKHTVRLIAIALCMVSALYACSDKPANITMVTGKVTVVITLSGSGEVRIDWGDGSEPHVYTLSDNYTTCTHTYSDTSAHTVRIYGEKIMLFDCDDNQITDLDVINNTTLTILYCNNNKLTGLDVRSNTLLTLLNCENNQITSLDVSNNKALTHLVCHINKLTTLDVSNNTTLTHLSCGGNPLTSLDVSNNTALTTLWCYYNNLTKLDVSNNTALTSLDCGNNQLFVDELNSLFGTLHSNTLELKDISIESNPGTDGCDRSIATAKGWTVVVD